MLPPLTVDLQVEIAYGPAESLIVLLELPEGLLLLEAEAISGVDRVVGLDEAGQGLAIERKAARVVCFNEPGF